MGYQFEEVKVNKSKKQVVVYIIILLLVLLVITGIGIYVINENKTSEAMQYNLSKLENNSNVKQENTNKNNPENEKDDVMVIITGENKEENQLEDTSVNNEISENKQEEQKQNTEINNEIQNQEQENQENQQNNQIQESVQNEIKEETNQQGNQVQQTQLTDKEKFVENVSEIYNGEEGKRVFLTFDDGPSKAVTPYILDKLKEHNIKATFFVLGSRVKVNPELVKRAYDEGHYIANHSYSHKYSKIYKSYNTLIEEYNKTEKEIQKALGNSNYSSNLFRFPGGSSGGEYNEIKKKIKKELKNNDIAYLDWNALTNDAAGANTKEKIMKNLKETVGKKNNVVVLMHDAPDKILTYETLEEVIIYLKEKGYVFKTMYDLK